MHFCFLGDTASSLAVFCPSWEVALQFFLDFIRYSDTAMVKKLPSLQNSISVAYSQKILRDRCVDPCWNSHLIFTSIHCIITSLPLCYLFSFNSFQRGEFVCVCLCGCLCTRKSETSIKYLSQPLPLTFWDKVSLSLNLELRGLVRPDG